MKKHTLIRTISVIVIIVCCFVEGLCAGVIIESVSSFQTRWGSLGNYLRSASFLTKSADPISETEADTDTLFKPFWETWNLLHSYYVDQPLDENAMMEGAIRGMLESLGDPHTRYSDPKEYKQESDSMAGSYEGIGAWVDTTGDYLTISAPMVGSPAEEAGLRPEDQIIAIDGEDMTGIDPNKVLQQVLGPAGTSIVLTIQREGEDSFDVTITRRSIETPMAEGKMLDDGIAYIQMTQFGDLTTQEMRDALDELMAQNPKGLILDLRNNGGGYLQTAVEVAAEFLPVDSLVLTEKDGHGEVTEYYTDKGGGRALDVPMVVLINGGSASASEILTGALKHYERATIIGETSYGKGSVQLQPVLSNGGAVSVTIARWYTPSGEQIHGIGIEPDITVELTEDDYKNERDPQLDAAVSFLLGDLAESEETEDNIGVGL